MLSLTLSTKRRLKMSVINYAGATNIGTFVWNDTTMTSSMEGHGVVLDTTTASGYGVKLGGAAATILGIIADSKLYVKGDPIPIIGIPGQIVEIYGTYSADDLLKLDASGHAVTAGSTDPYFAKALATVTGGLAPCLLLSGGAIATNITWTRSSTKLWPTTDGDTVCTGSRAVDAAVIEMTAADLATNGTGTNVDLAITCKGSGVPTFTNGSETATLFMRCVVPWTQATTGTAGSVGRITNASVTANSVIAVVCAEDPGTNLVFSDVVAASGYFTVYTKDVTGTPTRAGLSGKKINYAIFSY